MIWLVNAIKTIARPSPCSRVPPSPLAALCPASPSLLLPWWHQGLPRWFLHLFTHYLPCITHQQCSSPAGALPALGWLWIVGMCRRAGSTLQRGAAGHGCDETPPVCLLEPHGLLQQAENRLHLLTSPSCLLYTDRAQRGSSSEARFEFRGLGGN